MDKEIEIFVNLYKATIDKFNDKFLLFKEVKSDEIGYWYSERNYLRREGQLGNSCMSSVNIDFFDIYMSNPSVCSLVIFKSDVDDTKIVGRALLWTLRDGKKYMDRIYTINDSDVQLFRDYAKENGWYVKKHNSSGVDDYAISPGGDDVNLNLTVDIKKGYYKKYPYLDTLRYWDGDDGTLSTSGGGYELESTEGYYRSCGSCDGGGEQECYECDGNGMISCSSCDGDGKLECGYCDGAGESECSSCDGEGSVDGEDCGDCGGDGSKECVECRGKGDSECGDCGGDGESECDYCDGRGNVECGDCG